MGDAKPQVSIIVPFYNIEKCVHYCMGSLLNQTFRDYEIVCVDDGSTDGTGCLLDEYSDEPNVAVYHKENGGLSEARNYGVSVANGKLVSFVDGDDVVSPYYLEALERCYWECGAGMVIGQTQYVSEEDARSGSTEWQMPVAGVRVEKCDTIEKYAYEEILPSACCRLAPLGLYRNRPFPPGVYYEEIETAAGYVSDVDHIAVVETPIYGYVMRSGSIVHRKQARFKQVEDYIAAIDDFNEFAGWGKGGDARTYFECLHYSRIYRLLNSVIDAGNETKGIQKEIVRLVRGNLKTLLQDNRASRGNKARFAILGLIPRAYDKVFELYEKGKSVHNTVSFGG